MITEQHAPVLRVVHATTVGFASVGRMLPRVLSDDRVARLAALNAAVRALREMGIAVASTSLGDTSGKPTIRIVRDRTVSIAALLDEADQRQYLRNEVGSTWASCTFRGCTVTWEERP